MASVHYSNLGNLAFLIIKNPHYGKKKITTVYLQEKNSTVAMETMGERLFNGGGVCLCIMGQVCEESYRYSDNWDVGAPHGMLN